MIIAAGLLSPSPAWETLLAQEGLPWKYLTKDEDWAEACSVIIVTRRLEGSEFSRVEGVMRGGGAILGSAHHMEGLGGMSTRQATIRYIVSDGDPVFSSVRLLDLALKGHIPREANRLRTDAHEHAVFAGELGGGFAVALPFDVQVAMADVRVSPKAFYSRRDRLPSERVSLVAKGEIRHLVRSALAWLHHARGIPYAHLWYFPGQSRSVACLRVDTDGAPKADIDTLYRIMHDGGVRGSWFLDVGAHEPWLTHFRMLDGQEIGLHCYEHRFGSDIRADEANMRRGLELLRAAGWKVPGFAAPFGTWTPAYGALIDAAEFMYSSEFAFAYDTLPLYPAQQTTVFRTLQIPIHPISIGSLRRSGAGSAAMREYFTTTAADLLARQMPLFFYHHPMHRHWDVVEAIVGTYQGAGVLKLTLEEYALWWRTRELLEVGFDAVRNHIVVRNGDRAEAADVTVHVVLPDAREAFVPAGSPIVLTGLQWGTTHAPTIPHDLRRTREIDARRLLGDIYSTMLRRLK